MKGSRHTVIKAVLSFACKIHFASDLWEGGFILFIVVFKLSGESVLLVENNALSPGRSLQCLFHTFGKKMISRQYTIPRFSLHFAPDFLWACMHVHINVGACHLPVCVCIAVCVQLSVCSFLQFWGWGGVWEAFGARERQSAWPGEKCDQSATLDEFVTSENKNAEPLDAVKRGGLFRLGVPVALPLGPRPLSTV